MYCYVCEMLMTVTGKVLTYKSPLHFIEHHSFENQGGVDISGGFILQPPALLPGKSRHTKSNWVMLISSITALPNDICKCLVCVSLLLDNTARK